MHLIVSQQITWLLLAVAAVALLHRVAVVLEDIEPELAIY
jgi:hypothetical protein